jgi:hypothetical protein
MFNIRNAVIVAMMQVGVIVAGVLACGVACKWLSRMLDGAELPGSVLLMRNYGFVALVIPLTWIAVALTMRERANVSENVKTLTYLLGIVILIGLIILFTHIIWSSFSNLDGGIGDKPNR